MYNIWIKTINRLLTVLLIRAIYIYVWFSVSFTSQQLIFLINFKCFFLNLLITSKIYKTYKILKTLPYVFLNLREYFFVFQTKPERSNK